MRAITAVEIARLSQFLRFCVVGAVGFVVDAGALLILLRVFGIDPIEGRLVSFSIAVLTTFELNRRWAFKDRGSRRYLTAVAGYLGILGL